MCCRPFLSDSHRAVRYGVHVSSRSARLRHTGGEGGGLLVFTVYLTRDQYLTTIPGWCKNTERLILQRKKKSCMLKPQISHKTSHLLNPQTHFICLIYLFLPHQVSSIQAAPSSVILKLHCLSLSVCISSTSITNNSSSEKKLQLYQAGKQPCSYPRDDAGFLLHRETNPAVSFLH